MRVLTKHVGWLIPSIEHSVVVLSTAPQLIARFKILDFAVGKDVVPGDGISIVDRTHISTKALKDKTKQENSLSLSRALSLPHTHSPTHTLGRCRWLLNEGACEQSLVRLAHRWDRQGIGANGERESQCPHGGPRSVGGLRIVDVIGSMHVRHK